MSGVLAVAAAAVGLAAAVWMMILAHSLGPGTAGRVRLLTATLWGSAAAGCLIAVLRRHEEPALAQAVVLLGTAAFWCVLTAALLAPNRRPMGRNRLVVTLTVATALVNALFALASPVSPSAGLPVLAGLVFLPGFAYLVATSGASRSQMLRLVSRVTSSVVAGSLLLAVAAPSMAYGTSFSDARRIVLPGVAARLSGLTPHPNFLGITAALSIVLALALRGRWRVVTVSLGLVALLLSESRVAAIAVVAAVGVIWIFRGSRTLGKTLVVVPLAVALVVRTSVLSPDFGASGLTADIAKNGRYRIWAQIAEQFQSDPLLGWGPLAFTPGAGSPLTSAGLLHAHNQFYQAVAEMGIVGLVLMIALTAALVAIAVRGRRDPVYPAVLTVLLLTLPTEPFLSAHLYGFGYALIPVFTILATLLSADADASGPDRDHLGGEKTPDAAEPMPEAPVRAGLLTTTAA